MEFCLYTVLVLTLSTTAVLGLPTGAPETACATLMPVGHDALDNQATGDVPFDVDISDLGPGPCYIPGDMYEIVLSGGMQQNTDFRGFIIQAQTVADGSPVGSFMGGTNSQPVCTSDTAATHTNRDEKTMVTLTWTAPPEGTGAIRFVVTFVDRYSPSNNLNVFWAGVETAMISEGNCLFFNPAMYTVNETAGVVQPAIYINTPLPSDLTIEVTSNDGTATGGDVDYMSGPYSVILPTNMTYVTFNISINDDTMSEQNENFTLTITNTALPSGVTVGYPDQATVTIVDDDPTYVMFNESAYNVDEDDGPVTPAVVLSRLPSTEVIIQVTNTGGSATGGVDYMSGPYSVTFAVNVTSAEFNIDIINDTMYEGNENFMLTFVQSTLPPGFFVGSIDQATVTIMEDDHACPVSNPCEQDCRIKHNTIICQCTNGYTLAADGISCIKCAKASRRSNIVKPTWHMALCNASNNDTLCSGTAISDQWVLTSAGCACNNGTGIEGLSIRFGKNRTCSYRDTNEVQFSVSEIHCYPAYDPSKLTVDIAAVKLHSPIPIDVIRQSPPLCIDNVRRGKKLFFSNGLVEIFGWGMVGESVESEATLKSTGNITVRTVLECKSAFKEEKVKYRAHGGIMCSTANTTSACTGNYGSAVIARKKRRLYFGGIVSKKTTKCGVANSYLAHSKLYTKLAYDWVSSVVQL